MVNFQSGLLGVSETSSDMRDLLDRETQDVRAAEAVALFCCQVKKWIGAFAAALGGLDTLVFAGGIGENAPTVGAESAMGWHFLESNYEDETSNERTAAMLIKAKTLKGCKLHGLDGEIGKVTEFYFDDRHWTIRYLVADTGNWLTDRQVLISPMRWSP